MSESVCVTALNAKDTKSLWVAKGPGVAAAKEGIYVFAGGQALPTGLAIGSKVDVIGTVSAFKSSGSTAPECQLEFTGCRSRWDRLMRCTVGPGVPITTDMATRTTGGTATLSARSSRSQTLPGSRFRTSANLGR